MIYRFLLRFVAFSAILSFVYGDAPIMEFVPEVPTTPQDAPIVEFVPEVPTTPKAATYETLFTPLHKEVVSAELGLSPAATGLYSVFQLKEHVIGSLKEAYTLLLVAGQSLSLLPSYKEDAVDTSFFGVSTYPLLFQTLMYTGYSLGWSHIPMDITGPVCSTLHAQPLPYAKKGVQEFTSWATEHWTSFVPDLPLEKELVITPEDELLLKLAILAALKEVQGFFVKVSDDVMLLYDLSVKEKLTVSALGASLLYAAFVLDHTITALAEKLTRSAYLEPLCSYEPASIAILYDKFSGGQKIFEAIRQQALLSGAMSYSAMASAAVVAVASVALAFRN